MVAHAAADYDAAPYLAASYPKTQPTRLAAVATMLGLSPPPVASARVLELGCATGANIIPLAARFPDMQCTGIDVSGVQIERGLDRIQRLGLTNVELRQQSITEIDGGAGPFDYIICHGVYSWVPEPVREATLRVVTDCLSDDGVAEISYNVSPGWYTKRIVRDILQAYAADAGDAVETAARVRELMALLRKGAPNTAYGAVLRSEADLVDIAPDDYIVHDLLERENSPFSIVEFAGAARRHGLGYLADSDVHLMFPDGHGEHIADALRQFADGGVVSMEHNIDVITGRSLRHSLVVKQAQAEHVRYALGPRCMAGLHVSGRLDLDRQPGARAAFVFHGAGQRSLSTNSRPLAAALSALSARYPATATPNELMTAGATEQAIDETVLLDALFRLLVLGMIDIHSEPIRLGTASAQWPVASALARLDAQLGAANTTNLRHEWVALTPLDRLVLPWLDGSHDRRDLSDSVLQLIQDGTLELTQDGATVTDDEGGRRGALAAVETVLAALASRALLEPVG
ncbi:class I SAM-dependent methyltransferase [Mycobacterium sp. CVI_P3]|uniref:Class I SAM-dependent methyltransferase n=1 Tax=Mycobacterium pinniadriaticum TaxID=2994102 RepID=A0ABT3SR29_9MYCO|nr:class I SAM-dependent methyltransferase [Mycobacterium pinniadriaticum]MCX2934913.1 class I SAM-dependent methyltransferase [Mycobacterium pinniadriaticum]MCX2941335.1 class I SAM-dependent methyltransferase [Mycobacterium pinniadriaticum]